MCQSGLTPDRARRADLYRGNPGARYLRDGLPAYTLLLVELVHDQASATGLHREPVPDCHQWLRTIGPRLPSYDVPPL